MLDHNFNYYHLSDNYLKRQLEKTIKKILKLASLLIFTLNAVNATEYIRDDIGTPVKAADLESTLHRLGRETQSQPPEIWQKSLSSWDALVHFATKSKVSLNSRTYRFETRQGDDLIAKAVTTGGELSFLSGSIHGWQAGLSYFTTKKLSADSPHGETLLLGPGEDDFGVLGLSFLRYSQDDLHLNLYRQGLNLPYLNNKDAFMIPNAFEAYTLTGTTDNLSYHIGHVTKMKLRNRDDFIPMAEVWGADSNSGLTTAGAHYAHPQGFEFGGLLLNTRDLFQTTYFEMNWLMKFAQEIQLKTSLQHSRQRSIGEQLIGDFDTHSSGVRGAVSFNHILASLSYMKTSKSAGIISPFGSRPGFNGLLLDKFDGAGEKSWNLALSYELSRIGLPGLGITTGYSRGWDAQDPKTGLQLAAHHETDIYLNYKLDTGTFKDLSFRLQYATESNRNLPGDREQLRVVINYEFKLL